MTGMIRGTGAARRQAGARRRDPFHQDGLSRKAVVVFLVLPLPATVYAVGAILLGHPPPWLDAGILAGTWALTGLGVSVGLHRTFTNHSTDAGAPMNNRDA